MVMTGSSIGQVASKLTTYGGQPVDREDVFGVPGQESMVRKDSRSVARAYLQQATEEGDVVRPFLKGVIEQRQGSLDARRIAAVILVFFQRPYK
jgi:hypothetical protein